jgi:lipoyl(octanoyl) transferase
MIVENWGVTDYSGAWDRQKDIFRALQDDSSAPERIVFTEHKPVYTLGFHGNASNMIASEQMLRSRGAELVRIERGGDITYHGPGQLVVYPLLRLTAHHLGVKQYIECLEKLVIETVREYGIEATCNKEAIGVWVDWGKPTARKICAIGVKISHGVTMHGLALNVNTDLSAFTLINPCGFTDKGVTSIEKEVGHPVEMTDVIRVMCKLIPDCIA